MKAELDLVTEVRSELGEGPSWDAAHNRLYWVDITGKNVHVYHPNDKSVRSIPTGQYTGCAVPRKRGGLVCALQRGFFSLDVESGDLSPIASPADGHHDLAVNRFNDGKCDTYGRFWAGTTSFDEAPRKGRLFCLDTNHHVILVRSHVTVSNGMGWSPDNRVMYYIDSPTKRVLAFDFDLESGAIGNERVAVDFAHQMGNPDGMAVDVEGMLWIAHWDGYQISRWNPVTGERIQSIPLPVARVTSCVFGGEGLNELYITSAQYGLEPQQLDEQPLAGRLFHLRTDTMGLPTYAYRG
ncbi:SMP-30/gluconolactonase/LRE family protein [Alicyclobacillus fastidiosus]|uniref:SMP-30/gluconolactonase/LRE family protein n=1 Tax=Alicyclobacillus fastidiosus TaxID=392011 RepID=A0ABY6ZI72_9BACL|nr:SMP-30/gluconolactonase/LRE family protein [Alicyclobacillus fastidiosus]WAH42552.1 SMP-30/gluconolactonase/LRE family protein [Alicyclobacillus fastidiosus]GMA64400.1 regucalcin-like protein [Alicyclobacillus fastidiosus]